MRSRHTWVVSRLSCVQRSFLIIQPDLFSFPSLFPISCERTFIVGHNVCEQRHLKKYWRCSTSKECNCGKCAECFMINHTLQTFHLIFNMEFSVDEHKNIFKDSNWNEWAKNVSQMLMRCYQLVYWRLFSTAAKTDKNVIVKMKL